MAVAMFPSPPRHITIVIPTLTAGGAARIVSNLTAAWAERRWPVQILTFDDGDSAFPIHPSVTCTPLHLVAHSHGNVWRGLWNNLKRLRTLRKKISTTQPDLVLSFIDQTNVMTVLALLGTGMRVAVWENTDPAGAENSRYTANWGRRFARFVYPFANAIVAQTDEAAAFLRRSFGQKVVSVPNPILPPPAIEAIQLRRPAIIGLGRLVQEKGFDLLLRAHALNAARYPNWHLYIFGEGPERSRLEMLVEELGLRGRVDLPGALSEPTTALRSGDLFVVSSHIEGFSLVLAEAMACGLPVIATDAGGPRSIIRNEYDGLLVPPGNVDILAAAMARLMGDDGLRMTFAARAPGILKRYSLQNALSCWDALFDRMCGAANYAGSHSGISDSRS